MAPLRSSVLAAITIWIASVQAQSDSESYPVQQYSWYKKYSPQPHQYCFYGGCYTGTTFTFNSPPPGEDNYYHATCSNMLMIKSVWACGQKYCTKGESEAGRKLLNDPCKEYADITLPTIDELWLSPEELAQVPVLGADAVTLSQTSPLNNSAIPNQELFDLGHRTLATFYKNWDLGAIFAFAMVGFWGLVILVGMIHRITEVWKRPFMSRETTWWLWVRKNLILPATFGEHQAEAVGYTYTIPPRLETLLLILFLIMNVLICFPGYELWNGNIYYPDKKLQLARYIGDRTGYFSIGLLPMVWVFAARNNFFMWLTGWSFATFNRFHRWIARISVAHAIAHSIAWTMYEIIVAEDYMLDKWYYYKQSYADQYWYMGVIATVIMSLMIVTSAWIIRERAYDLFLIVHIAMSVVFFVTLWYHVRIFSGEFNYWLYICIAIWAIDRLIRLGRTALLSVIPRFVKGVKATASYERSTEIIRLDITEFLPSKPIVPGLFYFLYMPGGFRGYESHPFTLCSWRRANSSPPSSPVDQSLKLKDIGTKISTVPEDYNADELAHTFLIRPYKGMTGRLHQKLVATQESVASTQETIFLEGPYGQELDLSHYSDVLVICGGSGITAAISHSHYLMSKNSTTRVHIAWAVPQRHLPDDICANELASVIHSDRVNMVVYLTDKAKDADWVQQDQTTHTPYEVRLGRPDVGQVMRDCRVQARTSLAVVTCGTPQMSDICRKTVVQVLGEEGVYVGYYNETMIW